MFQRKSGKETAIKRNKKFHKVGEEFADVVLHCLVMANVLDTHLRCHAEEAEKEQDEVSREEVLRKS